MVIAIRWSPWLSHSAPVSCPTPSITMPSGRSSILAPNLERPSTVARMRSDSFTLSSPASLMTVVPSAKQAARAITGSSSITRGMISPEISVPRRLLDSATRSALGSPASSRAFWMPMRAPMERSTSSTPVREGLMPIPSTVSRALGWQQPATSQKAAPLMSPGTRTSMAESSEGRTAMPKPSVATSAPMASIIRSVWSREAAGSLTLVSPSACIPAIRMDDLS